jgi:hypothetical protein
MSVNWSSSSGDVVIQPDGIAVGQKPGATADITAADPNDGILAGSIGVTVVAPVVLGIQIAPTNFRTTVGQRHNLRPGARSPSLLVRYS